MASLAKLTSISTQTLSLLLERQRLQTISGPPSNSLHLPQITRNLNQLRSGILELEGKDGPSEAVRLLKSQYERMRGMLGDEAETAGILRGRPFAPYTDDPESGYNSSSSEHLLQTQRHIIDEQDVQLDRLSHSINRQRDLSLQIGEELDVHTGLLEELDTELDRTGGRLSGARRRLDRVAKGAKENGSTVMIALLILVLLILIIIFKT
ncbi:hypothetical protein K474DRAFT_1685244 [Panus rudis PR-1116 ss-1]|nr:hypothetical protein K474DRAFT_1685244 [Panus rudis PR-1116 ss-1]